MNSPLQRSSDHLQALEVPPHLHQYTEVDMEAAYLVPLLFHRCRLMAVRASRELRHKISMRHFNTKDIVIPCLTISKVIVIKLIAPRHMKSLSDTQPVEIIHAIIHMIRDMNIMTTTRCNQQWRMLRLPPLVAFTLPALGIGTVPPGLPNMKNTDMTTNMNKSRPQHL